MVNQEVFQREAVELLSMLARVAREEVVMGLVVSSWNWRGMFIVEWKGWRGETGMAGRREE